MVWSCSCPTSVPHKFSFGQMGTNSHRHTHRSCRKLSQKSGGCCNPNYISMVFECDVQVAHTGAMVRCLLTFGHIVYM